jgi:hypothetical protein
LLFDIFYQLIIIFDSLNRRSIQSLSKQRIYLGKSTPLCTWINLIFLCLRYFIIANQPNRLLEFFKTLSALQHNNIIIFRVKKGLCFCLLGVKLKILFIIFILNSFFILNFDLNSFIVKHINIWNVEVNTIFKLAFKIELKNLLYVH